MKVLDIVKAIEVLKLLEHSSMAMLEDPRYVGQLQAQAIVASISLELALEGLKVEVKS